MPVGMDRVEKIDGDLNPAAVLADDNLIVEILSRLPFKSVCPFKCVSRHWLHGLITSPAHRAKLPQTLTGFFRCIDNLVPRDQDDDEWVVHLMDNHGTSDTNNDHYVDVDEDDAEDFDSDDDDVETLVPDFLSIVGEEGDQVVSPSLSFLPRDMYRSVVPKHCSNGLLVCLCWKVSDRNEPDFVVCNPATQQWVVLPVYGHRNRAFMPLHLAVDPASSADSGHFHLFALLESDCHGYIAGVDIYSSITRAWSHHESGWTYGTALHYQSNHLSVFLHGMLHLVTRGRGIVAVDTGGAAWRTIQLPEAMKPTYWYSNAPFIGESRGRLHYINSRSRDHYALAVWTLESGDEWVYRYDISTPRLFAAILMDVSCYSLVAIHPERNIIYFTSRRDNTLQSYDFDHGEFRLLGTLRSFSDGWSSNPYLPYVPSWRPIAS